MGRLLNSLINLNNAKQQSDRNIESHIVMDDGVSDGKLTSFSLQLLNLIHQVARKF